MPAPPRFPTGLTSVKRVIAEMGGKNAILIDDDADLDEAVLGVDAQRLRLSGTEVLGLFARHRARLDLRRRFWIDWSRPHGA